MSGTRVDDLLGPLNAVERKFAPPVLWTLGHADLLRQHPRVAVVGTRNPTKEGAQRTTRLVRELVAARAVVVSGLAAGIDTIGHTHTIELGGRTIAVIGTPVDDEFPKANARLQQRVGRDHLVVSEFAPDTPVGRGSFPRRNRTMALIADASVIVEAGHGTVRIGRPLFLLKSLVDLSAEVAEGPMSSQGGERGRRCARPPCRLGNRLRRLAPAA